MTCSLNQCWLVQDSIGLLFVLFWNNDDCTVEGNVYESVRLDGVAFEKWKVGGRVVEGSIESLIVDTHYFQMNCVVDCSLL